MELRTKALAGCLILAGCGSAPPPKTEAKAPPKADPPKIKMFYASPPNPHKGEKINLCYGVENADEVTLDPPVDRVWPSFSHCLEVTPTATTTYTLTAKRGDQKVSQSVTVTSGPPALKLIEVSVNKLEVKPGEQVIVCYKAQNATRVDIKPGTYMTSRSPDGACVTDNPTKTTTYVVTASGAGGQSDSERVTVKVK